MKAKLMPFFPFYFIYLHIHLVILIWNEIYLEWKKNNWQQNIYNSIRSYKQINLYFLSQPCYWSIFWPYELGVKSRLKIQVHYFSLFNIVNVFTLVKNDYNFIKLVCPKTFSGFTFTRNTQTKIFES